MTLFNFFIIAEGNRCPVGASVTGKRPRPLTQRFRCSQLFCVVVWSCVLALAADICFFFCSGREEKSSRGFARHVFQELSSFFLLQQM